MIFTLHVCSSPFLFRPYEICTIFGFSLETHNEKQVVFWQSSNVPLWIFLCWERVLVLSLWKVLTWCDRDYEILLGPPVCNCSRVHRLLIGQFLRVPVHGGLCVWINEFIAPFFVSLFINENICNAGADSPMFFENYSSMLLIPRFEDNLNKILRVGFGRPWSSNLTRWIIQ